MRSRVPRGDLAEKLNVWPAFTDIMVGLLLIFVFVVTIFTITQTILSHSLSKKGSELDRLKAELSTKLSELERLSQELARLEQLFLTETDKAVNLQRMLDDLTAQLEAALGETGRVSTLLREREGELAAKDEALRRVGAESAEKSEALAALENRLAGLTAEVEDAVSRVREVTALLDERDSRIKDLTRGLTETEQSLSKSRADASEGAKTVTELQTRLAALAAQIAALNKRMASYTEEIERLNKLIAETRTSESTERAKAATLQNEIKELRAQLVEITKKLPAAGVESEKEFRLRQLVDLLGQKDQEIDRLRKLAKYRSEFLAKLEQIFSGMRDIKVQGDRFVFQSEILFGSGKTEINETGKLELDKFVRIYKEMAPKIPQDVDLIILVQGHTDIDPVRTAKYKSNWELSAARSMQVVGYLIEKGIPPNRVGVSALGEFHPLDAASTPEAKKLNRRIEIKITTL